MPWITGGLKEIKLSNAKDLVTRGFDVVPGQKLCPSCTIRMNETKNDPIHAAEPDEAFEEDFDKEVSCSSGKDSLDATLHELDVSPLKLHAVPKHSVVSHGKRKINQAHESLLKKVATVLDVDEEDLAPDDTEDAKTTEIKLKVQDLDHLIYLMKEKLKVANRRQRIQILTLTPNSWTLRKAAQEFKVSKATIQKARLLKKEKGIIAMPDEIRGKTLKKEIIDLVLSFYCDDEFTRQLPGKKDSVSIGKRQHMSKRLILCNIRELYTAFREQQPLCNIGFSKFASLRPKWCVPVGPKGTHSVCVCTLHQNVKLLLDSAYMSNQYKDLINMIVCNSDSKQCMIHRCSKCPGIDNVKESLLEIFVNKEELSSEEIESGDESDRENEILEEAISFKQWITADRSELLTQTASVEEFIDILCGQLDNITTHSFVAKSQANYLKTLKEEIKQEEVIVLGDFSENFKFVVQDESQGYHWNQRQCTLHPVVIYHKFTEPASLISESLCFLSDDLDHDVSMVYKILQETVHYIKEKISPGIKLIHYFSDGCAGQYKNCKNFVNLCHHQEDFGIKCEWNFFATSHGKSPCDGIGGTVKRLVAKASLQRPMQNQILSVHEMVYFCKADIKGIHFEFLSSSDISILREELKSRFQLARTVPGTRGYHQFVPISIAKIGAKRVSENKEFDLTFSFTDAPTIRKEIFYSGSFVVCRYDDQLWLGMISQADNDNSEVLVSFMHPHFPARSFTWPRRADTCWVPISKVLCVVDAPMTSTASGRQYCLQQTTLNHVSTILKRSDAFATAGHI